MSNELNDDLKNLLDKCRYIIKEHFVPCGPEEKAINRIKELYTEWSSRKSKAELENRIIGGPRVIYYDVEERLVDMARRLSASKRSKRSFCEYLEDALSKSYYVRDGLGYWSLSILE